MVIIFYVLAEIGMDEGYVSNDFGFTKRNYCPHEIEPIFIEIFLYKTKPMTVGINYRPPSQTNFLETMNKHCNKLDITNKETYSWWL